MSLSGRKTLQCDACGLFVPNPATVMVEQIKGREGRPSKYDLDYKPILIRRSDPNDIFTQERLVLCPKCYPRYHEKFKEGVPLVRILGVKRYARKKRSQ